MLLRVFPGHRGDFRRQQAHDDAVFIGGPWRAVKAQEGGPGALFAAEAEAAVAHEAVHQQDRQRIENEQSQKGDEHDDVQRPPLPLCP